MTKEDKELLLKDLSARVSYGIKCSCEGGDRPLKVDYIKYNWNEMTFEVHIKEYPQPVYNVEEVRPYLRPMSSMTEEEYSKYELTFDNVVVYSGHNNNNIHSEHRPTYETFDYLDSIHVDYRGLIEKGLALEAPKDMYKNT